MLAFLYSHPKIGQHLVKLWAIAVAPFVTHSVYTIGLGLWSSTPHLHTGCLSVFILPTPAAEGYYTAGFVSAYKSPAVTTSASCGQPQRNRHASLNVRSPGDELVQVMTWPGEG